MVGHSWGANLAIAYAQQHSHNLLGVVYLCGTGLEWWPDYAGRHKQRQSERLGSGLGARFGELRDKRRTSEEEAEYRLLYLRSELANPGDIELAHSLSRAERRYPVNYEVNAAINSELKNVDVALLTSRCRAVTVPVLVVCGESDPRPAEAVDSLIDALPDVTSMTVEGAGHWPWLEQPQLLRRLIENFIRAGGQSRDP